MSDVILTSAATIPESFYDGFEDGDVSEWSVNDLSISSSRAASGTYSGYCGTSSSGISQAERSLPQEEQINCLQFYYNETSNSTGSGVRVLNGNNDVELGVATDNPEWDIDDGNGLTANVNTSANYNAWIRVAVWFDWSASTYDISISGGGTRYYDTGRPLKNGNGVKYVQIDEYNGGWQPGDAIDTWFDNFQVGTSGSVDITVYEDIGDTGTTDNTETVSGIADGTNSYTLSTLDGGSGNSYRVEPSFSSVLTGSAILHSIELEVPVAGSIVLLDSNGVLQTTSGAIDTE